MEKGKLRKKLLALPLCLMLLVIPVAFNISEESENPFPVYENGVWHDGPWSEKTYLPPSTVPNVTFTDNETPSMNFTVASAEDEQRIQVTILLALEEEFYSYYYYTPQYGKINALQYALLQMDRASQHFEQVFNVEFVVVGVTTWHQDEEQDIYALYEVYEETGFKHNMVLPNGLVAEALVAWTLKLKLGTFEANGIATLCDIWTGKWYYTCIVRYNVYWKDDNTAQHEVSHLLNASDGMGDEHYNCYYSDCVMSYREKMVETLEEDGVIWEIYDEVGVTWLTNNWCENSREEINKWKWLYAQRDYIDPPYEGDC